MKFTLLESGNFIDADNDSKDFIVVPFEGKTSEEIYRILLTNAALVVNNPEKQVSGVEYALVKINVTQNLLTDIKMGIPLAVNGTEYFEFQIKDGRVKVNAPYINDFCHYGTTNNTCSFKKVLNGYFKNGKLKEKKSGYI